jgi:tetratricopeptide (TPR) repeat protein
MVPPEILNNLAVLLIEQGDVTQALEIVNEALSNCQTLLEKQDDTRLKALSLTLRFNKAWCCEQNQKSEEAADLYSAIIKEEPTYTDAYLRLSNMAKRRGEF